MFGPSRNSLRGHAPSADVFLEFRRAGIAGRVYAVLASITMTDHLVLSPVLPPWAVAAVVAALAAAIVAIAWRRPPAFARPKRVTLLVLRLAVVACVALALLRPEMRWEGRQEVRGEVAVLIDASRSMGIRDEEALMSSVAVPVPAKKPAAGRAARRPAGAPISRSEAVGQAFALSSDRLAALAGRFGVSLYAFGTHTRPVNDFTLTPSDPRTDFGEALGAILARKDPRLSAVIVISDGQANRAQQPPDQAARLLAEQGAKVHALVAGSDKPTDRVRDVAVRDLRAPARVFVGNRPEVRVVVATLGLRDVPLEAVLAVGGQEVERRRLSPASNQTTQEVIFTPQVTEPGLVPMAVTVAPAKGELITTNNRAETTVRVDEGGVRVLYLDGRIHPEGKYIDRALGEAKEIALERRILIGDTAAPSAADLDAFSVIILGDLPASALPAATIARIAEGVRKGNLSLLALGGLKAFGAGGWDATPLAEVLPFTIRAGDGQVPGPLVFRPTASAPRHFIFAADTPGGGSLKFDALPPLAGASAVGPLVPTARLLAETPDGKPLLVVREFARGRVAALTADTTWQWVLAPADKHGEELHRRLWRQLILWLAGRDAGPKADLWVMSDRSRYLLSDPDSPPSAEVTIHVRGGKAAAPTAELKTPGGEVRPISLVAADGALQGGTSSWRAVVPLPEAGGYTVAAEAVVDGQAKRAETALAVEEQDFELAHILADRAGMERIAQAGGGSVREIAKLGDLLKDMAEHLPAQYEPVEQRRPLGAGRLFLAAMLALLAGEWFLRRKWGAL